jgi:lysophospholipase L1-like esterase
MSSKHRAEPSHKPHHFLVLAAAVVLVLAGAFVMFWPPGPEPRAAGGQVRSTGEPAIEQRPLEGAERLVVYGHSMPTGGGASDSARAYAELTAEATELQLLNRAEGGTLAVTASRTMAALPKALPSDVVVIHTGMNDIFRRGDDAVAMGRDAIRQMLSGTSTAVRQVLMLECQPFSWMDTPPKVELQGAYDAWNAMLREEAAAADVDVLDTCAEWNPEDYTDVPKFHPNDEGHALIAEELVALLRAG